MSTEKVNKKVLIGRVYSDKMDKTITVLLEERKRHRLYKKFVKELNKVKAHDEKNDAKKGDLVKVIECRPFSKEKSWRLVEILEKAK